MLTKNDHIVRQTKNLKIHLMNNSKYSLLLKLLSLSFISLITLTLHTSGATQDEVNKATPAKEWKRKKHNSADYKKAQKRCIKEDPFLEEDSRLLMKCILQKMDLF